MHLQWLCIHEEQAHDAARRLSDSHDVVSTQRFSSERWCFYHVSSHSLRPKGTATTDSECICSVYAPAVGLLPRLVCLSAQRIAPKLSASHDVGLNRGIQLQKMVCAQ